MGLPEVAAQKGSPIHAIVRRVADEDVLALKTRRRHHLENHLTAARTDDLVRAGAAEKRQARQVPLDNVGALLDDPAHVGLRVARRCDSMRRGRILRLDDARIET
jgi:hypothetical protein